MNRSLKALKLFEEAVGLSGDQLELFLNVSCEGDEELRAEVKSLLSTLDVAEKHWPEVSEPTPVTRAITDFVTNPHFAGVAPLLLMVGDVLNDRYEIVGNIGAGGMGEVYRAKDARLERDVAIKILNSDTVTDAKMQMRFEREMKSLASLSHANIVTLHDISEHGETRFAVLEFVQGKTLRKSMKSGVQKEEAIRIAQNIAAGLNAAHSLDIMHRDIKPENIMLTDAGKLKILDFGLARRQNPNDETIGTVSRAFGTAPYMSPEQSESQKLTCATDIFSLGIVFYEMLTGLNPFRGKSVLETMTLVSLAQPRDILELVPDLPERIAQLVMAMLTHSPSDRPPADEIARRLKNYVRSLPGTDSTLPLSPKK